MKNATVCGTITVYRYIYIVCLLLATSKWILIGTHAIISIVKVDAQAKESIQSGKTPVIEYVFQIQVNCTHGK